MIAEHIADVATLIVGYRNAADIKDCLSALSSATVNPTFDVFICENGGEDSFQRLIDELLGKDGPCCATNDTETSAAVRSSRLLDIRRLRFRARTSTVWVARAAENLGYAGGINVWLEQLRSASGWSGVWVLNPDTKPQANALAALVERAQVGNKGMVGSTILDVDRPDKIRCRGGLRWQRSAARCVSIGLGEPLQPLHDVASVEAAMDCPSGASMYVTRACLRQVGPMDERYFLFCEDLDWGLRAKQYGLGYASSSIVTHKRGTTTGSAMSSKAIPRLSVYLQHRNGIHLVRRHFPRTLPICVAVLFLRAVEYLVRGAPDNFRTAMLGMLAGLKGEIGRPTDLSVWLGRADRFDAGYD